MTIQPDMNAGAAAVMPTWPVYSIETAFWGTGQTFTLRIASARDMPGPALLAAVQAAAKALWDFTWPHTVARVTVTELQLSSSTVFELRDPAPEIDSITPTTGPFGGGTPVTITGSNLSQVNRVQFAGPGIKGSGWAADVVVVNPQTVTCVTPEAHYPYVSTVIAVLGVPGPQANLRDGFTYT